MLGLWTANHGVAWKNRKKTVFNNVPLLDYKYDCLGSEFVDSL